MTGTVTLPARLDLTAVGGLAGEIKQHAGQPLTIDATAVETLGGLCLQLLLASAAQWKREGQELMIPMRSDAFDDALSLLGVNLSQLQNEVAA